MSNGDFETDPIPRSTRQPRLKLQAARGVLWNLVARFGQQGIQLLVTIILARVLAPEDFGLIGLLTVFIAVSQAISDGGFGKSLIQKQDADQLDESSMFFFNLAVSVGMWIALFLLAPLVAWFYDAPELTWLLRVLGLNVILAALGMVQFNVLARALNFRTLLVANWTATFVSGVVGVGMALLNYGVWSLVGQMLAMQGARSVMLWWLVAWRPTWQFSFQRLRAMLPFGSNLLLVSVTEAIFQNIYLVVIGMYHSIALVGYYRQAHALQMLPMSNFLTAINQVMFPAFARVQEDRERLKRAFRQTFRLTAFAMMAVMALLAAVADPLVPLLFSEKWRPAVPYLQLLCVVGALVPLQSANFNAMRAIGRSGAVLRAQLVRKGLILGSIVLTAPWGVEAMILGQIGALLLSMLQVSWSSRHLLNYRYPEQWFDVGGVLLVTVISGGVALSTGWLLSGWNDWIQLAVQLLVGGLTMAALASASRLTAWRNLYSLWQELRCERREPSVSVLEG